MIRFFDRWLDENPKLEGRYDSGATEAALMLWDTTGHDRYREIGTNLFMNIMRHGEQQTAANRWARQYGDFDSYPITHAALLLKHHGLLEAKWESMLRSEHLALQEKGLNWRHGNRELGKLSGPILAAFKMFPNDPAFKPLRKEANLWWEKLNKVGCLDESSGNYSSLGLCLLIDIARSMNREADLRENPRWRNTFTMYRDLVSPSGHMPEWGDDYFEEGGKINWCYLFEYAGNLYQDPQFAWAARKLFQRQNHHFKDKRRVKMGQFRQVVELLNLQPMIGATPLSFVSGVNNRYDAAGVKVPFMLLIRPDLNPGSPMIMMDLYSLSDHAHMEKRGSITYQENNYIPLFHGQGRHHGRHAGDGGNNFYLQPHGDTFPLQPWENNTWYTVRIPAERFNYSDTPGKNAKRRFASFQANFIDKKEATLYLDNLRLEGPAGVKIIDAFDEEIGASYSTAKFVDGGDRVSILEIPPQARSFSMRDYGIVFDPAEYQTLAYDIKWVGNEAPELGFRYREDTTNMYNAWHKPGALRPFHTNLERAHVETKGKDNYAEIRFTGYGTWDTSLIRRMVLTKEGALVIRDTVIAGKTAAGWTGGEVWQFQEKSNQGENWFAGKIRSGDSCVPGDTQVYHSGKLAYFEKTAQDTFASCQASLGTTREHWLAFTKFKLEPGKTYPRFMAIVPYTTGQIPQKIAEGITAHSNVSKSKMMLTVNKTPLIVTIGENGQWSVHRVEGNVMTSN